MEILDLRPTTGWRVAVATKFASGQRSREVLPMVGWAREVVDDEGHTMWLPCWWDDLGVTTGAPNERAWPLAEGEEPDDELWAGLFSDLIWE